RSQKQSAVTVFWCVYRLRREPLRADTKALGQPARGVSHRSAARPRFAAFVAVRGLLLEIIAPRFQGELRVTHERCQVLERLVECLADGVGLRWRSRFE